jgi:hypothetical protein
MQQARTMTWLAAALLAISALAYSAYLGSPGPYILFDMSFVAMLALVLPRPRSHGYLFFALMLFLGFWSKLMARLIFGTEFLEPTGNFSGSAENWDRVLEISAAAALGVSLARLAQLQIAGRCWPAVSAVEDPPRWYVEWRRQAWIVSILAMLALNLLNFQLGFYQTGVNPRLVLPLHLNVLTGWLVNIGFALWFAVLVHWEFQRAPRSLGSALVAPVVESLASSTSALSRSFYLLHSLAYFFAVGAQWTRVRAVLSWRTVAGFTVLWGLCFAISLTAVSWLRIHFYTLAYQPEIVSIPAQKEVAATPVVGADVSNQIAPMVREVSRLFLERWIGLEGVLAVSSYPDTGLPLFLEGIREDPKKGNDTLYQRISKSQYQASERFTFLTLPGIVGVLFYSGSLATVVAGTLFVTLLMMATELAALRLTANPFLVSLVALGMANVAAQMNFVYLSAIFVAQLWVAIAFVWLLRAGPQWWRRRRSEASARA